MAPVSAAEVSAMRPLVVSMIEPIGMFAVPVSGPNFVVLPPAGALPAGYLMRTLPETTRTTTDLPGTGGGGGPAGCGWGAAAGAVVLRNTLSVLTWSLDAAMSGLPSPLKSPAATPLAPGAARGAPSAAKLPPAWRRSTVTVPAVLLVTARSGRPSALKSAVARPSAPAP